MIHLWVRILAGQLNGVVIFAAILSDMMIATILLAQLSKEKYRHLIDHFSSLLGRPVSSISYCLTEYSI